MSWIDRITSWNSFENDRTWKPFYQPLISQMYSSQAFCLSMKFTWWITFMSLVTNWSYVKPWIFFLTNICRNVDISFQMFWKTWRKILRENIEPLKSRDKKTHLRLFHGRANPEKITNVLSCPWQSSPFPSLFQGTKSFSALHELC